jgi:hypothetical protein
MDGKGIQRSCFLNYARPDPLPFGPPDLHPTLKHSADASPERQVPFLFSGALSAHHFASPIPAQHNELLCPMKQERASPSWKGRSCLSRRDTLRME